MKIGYLMQAGVPEMRTSPLSGPANHVKHVIDELRGLGHQVRLIALQDSQIWASDDLEHYRLVKTPSADTGIRRLLERIVRRTQSTFKLPYAAWFESMRFAEACCRELDGFDLLYERMGWVGYGGSITGNRLNIPLILEVNGDHLTELESLGIAPKGLQRRLSVSLMNRMIKSTTHVISAGDGWRQRFIDQWDVAPEKVTTVENGSEMVDLLERSQLQSFCESGGTSNKVCLVFIGNFDPWQGIDVLFHAIAKVNKRSVNLKLLLIGSGPRKSELEKQISELGITHMVTFTGRLNPVEMIPYLSQADIGISSYCGRVEFSGLKLLDYKSAGLAVIASGQNGQPAVLKHSQTGWIVPPCNQDALAEAIIHLINNVDLRKYLGREARIEAETMHSWQHTAQQLEQIFFEVIKQ